jgi:hypothetical protein
MGGNVCHVQIQFHKCDGESHSSVIKK